MSEEEYKIWKALKILDKCHLCNGSLSASQKKSPYVDSFMVLSCKNKNCCSDHRAKANHIIKFVCHVDIETEKIHTYYVDIKIDDKEYCISATDREESGSNIKKTEIFEWFFTWLDFDDCGFTDKLDFSLLEDPIITINDYFEPDGTKEFYTNLTKRLLKLKAFS